MQASPPFTSVINSPTRVRDECRTLGVQDEMPGSCDPTTGHMTGAQRPTELTTASGCADVVVAIFHPCQCADGRYRTQNQNIGVEGASINCPRCRRNNLDKNTKRIGNKPCTYMDPGIHIGEVQKWGEKYPHGAMQIESKRLVHMEKKTSSRV